MFGFRKLKNIKQVLEQEKAYAIKMIKTPNGKDVANFRNYYEGMRDAYARLLRLFFNN